MTARVRLSVWVLVIVLALVLGPASVSGEGAPPGMTGGYLSQANAGFIGENAGDFAGVSVVTAGDVNGDGYDDILIGARDYDTARGAAYLVLGGPHGWQFDQGLWTADAIYTGEAENDRAGWDVAGAGDVNADGFDDMLIGADGYDDGMNWEAGRTYLVLGSAAPASLGLGSLGPGTGAMYTGNGAGEHAGHVVAGAGDVNGDGYDDLLIGGPDDSGGAGIAYVILGAATPSSTPLASADAYYTGENSGDHAGSSVAGAGDVNGDGYADMLIGAYGWLNLTGRAYLVLGNGTLVSGGLASAIIFSGQATIAERVGSAVAGGGDITGDGFADMLIGASGVNSDAGRVIVVPGKATLIDLVLGICGADTVRGYDGQYAGDRAGAAVGAAGDVNADGYADFIVGAWSNYESRGRAYLVLGEPLLRSTASATGLGTLGAGTGAIYNGVTAGDQSGLAVGGGGDINGDSYSDLLVGAIGYNDYRGRAYLLYSDFNTGTAARYRARTLLANPPRIKVGESGVTADYASAGAGSIYVTRYFQSTCNKEIATNGLLWRVDSEVGDYAQVELTFKYNDTQIAGMTEADLKLWGRSRTCGEWELFESDVDTAVNRVVGRPVTDPHLEFTLATSQPSPTLVRVTEAEVTADRLDAQDLGVLLALGLAAAAVAWERRRSRRIEN